MLRGCVGSTLLVLAAGCGPAQAGPPDETQVSEVVEAMQDAYATSDWMAFRRSVCAAQKLTFDDAFDPWLSRRPRSGPGTFAVEAVRVDGDRAEAVVRLRFANREFDTAFGMNPVRWSFVREYGRWTWCL